MDKPRIGIRQADGSFYEIMDESHVGHKRLTLSAARVDQHGVKIDLYRSEDGHIDPAGALGTITIDDQDGLGYQDIEFRVDLDDGGQLNAAANLPGQPPRTLSVDLSAFRNSRTDAEILGDESLDTSDLDTLDDTFNPLNDPEPELLTMDLPELDEPAPERTDAEILEDDSLDTGELDSFDTFGLDNDPEEDLEEVPSLTPGPLTLDLPQGEELDAMEDFGTLDDFEAVEAVSEEPSQVSPGPSAAADFDLGDLDAGFGDGPSEELDREPSAGAPAADEWETIDLDGLEPMEFLDTGDEISSPLKKVPVPGEPPAPKEDFSLDEEEPLELADLDSDISDLPDLEELGENSQTQLARENDLDQDFLPPPALTDLPSWEPGPPEKPSKKSGKKEKHPKSVPAEKQDRDEDLTGGNLDKTALFLSLTALVLLVILIVVLLVLNLFRSPAVPVIQPEVQRWKPLAETSQPQFPGPRVRGADLGAATPEVFNASSVLEVPRELRVAEVTLKLAPGETAADAARRFGAPARVQGNLLYW